MSGSTSLTQNAKKNSKRGNEMTKLFYGAPHGGIWHSRDFCLYMETGKKSPGMPSKFYDYDSLPEIGIHEGEWVRQMLSVYSEMLWDLYGLETQQDKRPFLDSDFLFMGAPEYSPASRAAAVNLLVDAHGGDCIYIEPHVNASGNDWSAADGHRVFYNDQAKDMAKELSHKIALNKPINTKERTPSMAPKSWSWFHKIKCPAMLCELFFMTNQRETEACQGFEAMGQIADAFHEFHLDLLK